ncbi:hypothetical protein [Burkholderia vietnamiensis]|uniref:hypothetical protein n=1 Tax=Burkholderia vietnamiensis TaxID=60552 RepID=UPI001CF558B0|nr:hypothetical protein [Burkholderia vietnamiensis]MCA8287549.1 hypothetical protein [Burkholderia vietnamiensis]
MAYFLRMGNDYLEDAVKHGTKADAIAAFRETSDELDRYGQSITASIHIADTMEEVVEYPDFVLERGPRGGVKVERA